MSELKSCPFCGKGRGVLRIWPFDEEDGPYVVLCSMIDDGCGAEGPHKGSKEEAITAWNRREGEDE